MELNISKLENMNPYETFDYNKFEQEHNYWEQEKPIKKKVTFDDILTNMNLVVNKQGVLQFMSLQQNQTHPQTQNPQNQKHLSKQQIQEPIAPSLKHSFIYNKYFKDYIDPNLEKQSPRVPKTMEELKKMLIQNKIINERQKQIISQIKSTKLMFTTNPNINIINPKNIVASKNNLRTMTFR